MIDYNIYEHLVIQNENDSSSRTACILDDHRRHIKAHLPFFWKWGMISHLFQHLILWRQKQKLHLDKIFSRDIIKHCSNPLKWYE